MKRDKNAEFASAKALRHFVKANSVIAYILLMRFYGRNTSSRKAVSAGNL